MGIPVYVGQMRWCWNAQAAAPVRLETPTLSKMLLTWRATVLSLMNNSSAAPSVFTGSTLPYGRCASVQDR